MFDHAGRRSAIAGYEYFGFLLAGQLIEEAEKILQSCQNIEEAEARLDQAYWVIIPEDGVLYDRFKKYYLENHTQFVRNQ